MKKPLLPNEEKDYYRFYQVPARKWWFGLVGITAVLILLVGYMLLLSSLLSSLTDFLPRPESVAYKTIIEFLAGNLLIGGFIGVSVLVSWIFYRQGFGWVSSVIGKFRWKWFALSVAVFGGGFLIYQLCNLLFFETQEWKDLLAVRPYTAFVFVSILLITPLQAAGEEFLFRGILGRLIGATVKSRKLGLVFSAIFPTLIFMLLHQDEHLINNVYYIFLSITAWWLVYRTGGIEASIALHASVNVCSQLVSMPFLDLTDMPARSDGGAFTFIPLMIIQLILTMIIDLLARRRGLVRMSSPTVKTPEIIKSR